MTPEAVMTIGKDMLWTSMICAAPALISGLIVGLFVSIFQAVTQVHEMTLTFIPKIVAAVIATAVFYQLIMSHLIEFCVRMFSTFPQFIN